MPHSSSFNTVSMLLPVLLALAPLGTADLTLAYDQEVYQAGQIVELTLTGGSAGTFGVIAFDPVPGPLDLPGVGTLGIGLSAEVISAPFGPLSGDEIVTLTCNVPCESPLVGTPLYTQAIGYSPIDAVFCLSNVDVLDVQGVCEGCTPGYWKNHPESWAVTGFDFGQDFDTVFGTDFFDPDQTLLVSLGDGGGDVDALGRHAVAGLLSAASPGVDYPLSPDDVIGLVQCAFIDGNVEEIKDKLEEINESFCPL
jgi:hypothetical protein